ncbi:MAG: pseudouridine synthase [Bythopirellula sp.]|nr:pseudouridine synthase [Bythopirellula sp.]
MTPRKVSKSKHSPRGVGNKPSGRPAPGKRPMGRPRRRPVSTPPSDLPGERLQKVLAAAGIASRRDAEEIILEGRVEVDGQVVTELGTRVEVGKQEIFVDGQRLTKSKLVYYAVNKPTEVVCTARDPSGRMRVIDLLPPDIGRVFNVGRLDMSSEGLILVTNDGELANQLTHPRHGVKKYYEVHVAGEPGPDVLSQLRRGVHLAEGFVKPVEVRIKSKRKNGAILEMVLDEGRNREVRRLLARVGHKVQRLIRIAVGPIRLGEMPKGASRMLTPEEVRKLHAAVNEKPVARKIAPSPGGQDDVKKLAEAARERKLKAAIGKANQGRPDRPAKKQAMGRPGDFKNSKTGKKSGKHGGPRKRGSR